MGQSVIGIDVSYMYVCTLASGPEGESYLGCFGNSVRMHPRKLLPGLSLRCCGLSIERFFVPP